MSGTAFKTFKNAAALLDVQRLKARVHHCRLAMETVHPRFRWLDGGHGVVLTVNSGYE